MGIDRLVCHVSSCILVSNSKLDLLFLNPWFSIYLISSSGNAGHYINR